MDSDNQSLVFIDNWNDLCRLCLRSDEPMQNLFIEQNLLVNVQEVLNLNFDPDDALPNSICKLCIEQVNSFIEFRDRSRATNEWLRQEAIVSNSDNKDPIDQEVIDTKHLLVEPDQLEEQLIDNPESVDKQLVENEIELSHCIVQTEEVMQISIDEVRTLETSTTDHKCAVCNKVLLSAYTLANHMRSHTGERPFGCRVCEKFFKTKSNLNEHYRVHNPELRWMKTSSRDIPSITRVTVTSEDVLTCRRCSKVFGSLDELSAHEQRTHGGPWEDEPPRPEGDPPREQGPLSQPQSAVSATAAGPSTFTCEQCNEIFGSKARLSAHIAGNCGANGGPAVRQCPFCNKPFRSAATLENHKRVHTREKPFNCDVCDKPFRTKGNLLEHKRVHNSSLWLMKSDTKLVATDNAAAAVNDGSGGGGDGGGGGGGGGGGSGAAEHQQRFQCTYCAKPFRTYTALLNHERVHTREKPFECSVCGKCFRTKSNMTEHMKGCHDIDSSACHAEEVQVFTFKTQTAPAAQQPPPQTAAAAAVAAAKLQQPTAT